MSLHFAVLYGSVRSDRQGIRAARFILRQLARRGHEATLVDPLETRLPLLDRMYKEYPTGEAPAELERLATMTISERAQLQGVSVARAPQLLGGAIVAEAAMDLLGVDSLEICPWALREGVILDRLDTLGSAG